MTTCYPNLSWKCWDKRLPCLKCLSSSFQAGWPLLSRPGEIPAHSTPSCEAHSGPCDRAEGEAGVMPAARPDTCSVLFVKGQASPGGCFYWVRLRSVLLPRTAWSLCFLSPVNTETKSEGQGRDLGGDPGTQETLDKNIKRTI